MFSPSCGSAGFRGEFFSRKLARLTSLRRHGNIAYEGRGIDYHEEMNSFPTFLDQFVSIFLA